MFSSGYRVLCIVILSFVLVACKGGGSSSDPVPVTDPVIPAPQQDVITPITPPEQDDVTPEVPVPDTPTPTPEPEVTPDIPLPDVVTPPVKDRTATLTWDAPFTRVNGDALAIGEIHGYTVHYGQDDDDLVNEVDVGSDGSGSAGLQVVGLTDGVWYFTVQTVDTDGLVSELSNTVSKRI